MRRPWLENYPPGVPATLGNACPPTLAQLIEQALQQYAERPATVYMGKSYTFRELDVASRNVAAWLRSQGVKPGARIALMLPNVPQYLVCLMAILRAGYIVVNINPLYTARELAAQLLDSGAEVIFILENFAATLQAVLRDSPVRHIVITRMGDMLGTFKGALVNGVVRHVKKLVPAFDLPQAIHWHQVSARAHAQDKSAHAFDDVGPDPNSIAFLQYTGGTTGTAKGAMLSHGNVAANVEQVRLWFEPRLHTETGEQRTIVSALPLYHIFALTCCLYGVRTGMCNFLIPNPRDLTALIRALKQTPPDIFPAVNTLFNALLSHPDFSTLDLSRLKISLGGGMAVQETVAARWKQQTGNHILEAYGLSETSPGAIINPVSITDYTGAIGLPIPATDVVILDDAGDPVPYGQPGEIAVRGPQVMVGYWNRPDETANVMTADGFLKTGDIGFMNEQGYVHLIDRKKDLILVSGFNVYPNEVEAVATQHPGVFEAAAVGVPDPHSGEVVKLFVVRKSTDVSAEDIKRFCQLHLTRYKAPRYVEFRDELPKSNVGKILRRLLREDSVSQP